MQGLKLTNLPLVIQYSKVRTQSKKENKISRSPESRRSWPETLIPLPFLRFLCKKSFLIFPVSYPRTCSFNPVLDLPEFVAGVRLLPPEIAEKETVFFSQFLIISKMNSNEKKLFILLENTFLFI